MYATLLLTTAALVLPLVAILGYLVVKAWPVLSWSFLVDNPKHYMTAGGLWAPLVGTFDVVILSLVMAAPIGVLAGIYLNEYARETWPTRIVNLAVVNLAGVPSIVHALFGVGMFVLAARFGRSVLAASCTLAVMTLPVIIASTKEALASVPFAFREACWILGASRWQTIRLIVLPNAISGILTGVILQVSRAAGETAPILFTGAVFYVSVPDRGFSSFVPYGWRDPFMALSYHLFTLATQVAGVSDSLAVRHGGGPRGTGARRQCRLHRPSDTAPLEKEVVDVTAAAAHIVFKNLTVRYAAKTALDDINLEVPKHQIFGIIGPAGSGKTTLLKCINRMVDVARHVTIQGQVLIGGEDVFQVRSVHDLRRRVGMVLPLPVGLPLSVYDNVAFAPRVAGLHDRTELDPLVEQCLRQAALWDEVKDRLHVLATTLSGGQQQRLTIARALSHRPRSSVSTSFRSQWIPSRR